MNINNMTREEKCKLAIEKGYTYEPKSGNVYGPSGKIMKSMNHGYIRFTVIPYRLYAHHFAWYWCYKECVKEIDHIDRNPSNNKIDNLRSVTSAQNGWNNDAKGWYISGNGYFSKIIVNKKRIYLGYFNTKEEAHQAYLDAKKIYHKI